MACATGVEFSSIMSNNSTACARYRFGEFILDNGRAALFRGDDGIPVRPQSIEVLRLRVANHGRLVTREEMLEEIWRGQADTDDSLTQRLIEARRTIGDEDRTIDRTAFINTGNTH